MDNEFILEDKGSLEIDHVKLILNHINEISNTSSDGEMVEGSGSDQSPPLTSTGKSANEESWLLQSKMNVDMTSDGMFLAIGGGGIGNGLVLVMQRIEKRNEWKTLITLDHQSHQPQSDQVTAVQFLPIGLTSNRLVIAVGYSSGTLRIFTLQGSLLLSQLLHNKPVLKLKCKCTPVIPGHNSDHHAESFLVQELLLVYPDQVVACVSGVSLITILQVCINQVSRGEYSGSNVSLSFRKWLLSSSKINDVALVGPFLGSPFRALPYSTTEQSVQRLYAAGREAMLSVYYPSEDTGSTFSVAISSVASRLTKSVVSYAMNWWSGSPKTTASNSSTPTAPEVKIELPVTLSQRWSMIDLKREIQTITADPSGRYAATTDNLGRVLLVDLVNSIIVRIWKGYRDAQCGFIQTLYDPSNEFEEISSDQEDNQTEDTEEQDKEIEDIIPERFLKKQLPSLTNSSGTVNTNINVHSKTHLVIYNGRRGILEIWGLKHQSREFFKNIGKGCKLISTTIPSHTQPQLIQNDRFISTKCLSKSFIIYPSGTIQEVKYTI